MFDGCKADYDADHGRPPLDIAGRYHNERKGYLRLLCSTDGYTQSPLTLRNRARFRLTDPASCMLRHPRLITLCHRSEATAASTRRRRTRLRDLIHQALACL